MTKIYFNDDEWSAFKNFAPGEFDRVYQDFIDSIPNDWPVVLPMIDPETGQMVYEPNNPDVEPFSAKDYNAAQKRLLGHLNENAEEG